MNQNELTKSERAKHKALNQKRKEAKRGKYRPEFKPLVAKRNWRLDEPKIPSSNYVPTGAIGTPTIMDNLHKESPEIQKAIIAKSKQLAPAFSKGAYQYISENEVHCIGRK